MILPDTLANKTAVITGGGQGFGQATAQTFHAAGANVAVTWFADGECVKQSRADATAQELGDRAIAVEGDVRDLRSMTNLFDGVAEPFGGLDIVVNNAGIIRDRSLKKMTEEEWHAVIDTNLSGVWKTCKAAQPFIRDGGRIVNLSSISGITGFLGQSNYAAAKAGVVGLTKTLSKELARQQITVNAVAPGVVLTEMGQTIPEENRQEMLKQIPLGRFGSPQDIAGAILFLCSPMADYITGQTIHVNGGWWG